MSSTNKREKNTGVSSREIRECSSNIAALEDLKKFMEIQLGNMQKALNVLDSDWMQLCNFSEMQKKKTIINVKPSNPDMFGDSTEINTTQLSLDLHNYNVLCDLPSDLEDDDM